MPFLRSMGSVELENLLDSKISEMQNSLPTKADFIELKNIILKQNEKIDELNKTVASLSNTVHQQEKKIEMLDSQVSVLQNSIKLLNDSREVAEQYSRRLCLRISNIPYDENEKNENCLQKVKDVLNKLKVNVPDECLDRAHRIGRVFSTKSGENRKTTIVRFSTWRHRSDVYYSRKNTVGKQNEFGISLDLTKERAQLLKYIRNELEKFPKSNVSYVFADINCQLKAKLSDGSIKSFSSREDFLNFFQK